MKQRTTLKNIKESPGMSDETIAFSASVYLDGKRVGTARNRGNGGCNEYAIAHEHLQELEAIARDLCPEDIAYEHLDYVVIGLVTTELDRQWLKRHCRKKTLYRLPDMPEGQYRQILRPYDHRVRAYIREKYPDATIINEVVA